MTTCLSCRSTLTKSPVRIGSRLKVQCYDCGTWRDAGAAP